MSVIEITTMIGCPLMCKFCPQDKLIRAYKDPVKIMSMETFATCINKLPKHYSIGFAGYTEPWANRKCTDFVEFAIEQGRNVSIFSTLFRMTRQDVNRLTKLISNNRKKFTNLCVHLPDSLGNMTGWTNSEDYQFALSEFKKLHGVNFMTMNKERIAHPSIQFKEQPIYWNMYTRAGNLDISKVEGQYVEETPKYEFIVECHRNKNLEENVLLPNGDVALCCMDYGLKHILGNLVHQSYDDIRNSTELQKIRKLNNTLSFTDEVLCKSCSSGHCRTPWNDDEIRKRVEIEAPWILNPNL